ncbi:hypothetical protein NE237_032033 [Protea cynaroides]|uniref:Uncharacterized protein n=1 Tax=Protea cynaroides TaxID=273540 RepID=A0A9Q0L388_9MAGN|nr:hypothetical protein NE237_032033 [Protea cynaroides]
MGRQSNDTIAISSSIALLQERFRELQRVKAMREERKLLKWFVDSERNTPTMHLETARLFFNPELILPPGPPHQGFLSHRANTQVNHANFRAVEVPLLMNFWPRDKANMHTSNNFDDTDIDTSLHL